MLAFDTTLIIPPNYWHCIPHNSTQFQSILFSAQTDPLRGFIVHEADFTDFFAKLETLVKPLAEPDTALE